MADRAQIASVNINRIKLVLLRNQVWETHKDITDKFQDYERRLQDDFLTNEQTREILAPLEAKLSSVSNKSIDRIKD